MVFPTGHSSEAHSEFYWFPLLCLAGFLAGKSESFVKNLFHFVQLLKSVSLQAQDTLISFDVVSLFTNISVDKGLQVIRNNLHNDDTLAE
jgi:hypothetical protein